MNAALVSNLGVESKGCLFHLSQNIYRKIVELGYKVRYLTDSEFSMNIRSMVALAFLCVNNRLQNLITRYNPQEKNTF